MKMNLKNNLKSYVSDNKAALSTKSAKVGSYSFLVTVLVLAILVAVNVLVGALPARFTQFDMSAAKLYSLTSDSKAIVQNVQDDVTIYWIVQSGKEGTIMEKLLNVYDGLSSHVTVEKKDPDVYPTFCEQYTTETVENNSVIVVSGSKSRYIPYSSIYETSSDGYSSSTSASFDGEGEITAAIDYVVSDDLPVIYVTSGHGEGTLSDSFTEALTKANMETKELNLLSENAVPEDADCVLIYAPTSDFSENEVNLLRTYREAGGNLFVISGAPNGDALDNLNSLLADYNISKVKGIAVESDSDRYAFSYPYMLLPNLESGDINADLIENNSNVLVPIAQGMSIGEEISGVTVTSLLSTSDTAYSKVDGYSMTTYEKQDGDIDGGFSVAVQIENSASEAKMVWISSDALMEDDYISYSSGANTEFVMNCFSWMVKQGDAITISSKSLSYNYLTISATTASWIKIMLIGIIPIAYLLYGVDEVVRRRKVQ